MTETDTNQLPDTFDPRLADRSRSRSFSIPLLLALCVFLSEMVSAQQVQIPEIPAFLPSVTKVKPSEPSYIDGLWSISALDKTVRIDRGRIYAIEGWTHMFVLKIQPGMVVIKKLEPQGLGKFVGEDLPLAGPLSAQLTGDRLLDVTVQGALGEVNYQLIPLQLDDQDWFNDEVRAVRQAGL